MQTSLHCLKDLIQTLIFHRLQHLEDYSALSQRQCDNRLSFLELYAAPSFGGF